MVFSYWGKWQALKHHLCVFCNISWKWWERSSFIHALTCDIWLRTKSCRKGWVMRCQGKMIRHTVRWCTLYFTVRFGVILSPVARKGSAWGGKDRSFSLHSKRESLELCSPKYPASLTFPSSLLDEHKTNCLFVLSFLRYKLFYLPSPPRNSAREKSTPSEGPA